MDTNDTNTGQNELHALTHEIEHGIRSGQYTWREIQEAVLAKTRETAAETDVYVRENPWKVVRWAGGLGFVLGLLMAPRSCD